MFTWFSNIFRVVWTVIRSLWTTLVIGGRTYDRTLKTFTEKFEYPELPAPIAPRFHGFHRYEHENCTGCGACARNCPADCIYIEKNPEKIEGHKGFWATSMTFDYGKCMFCALCAESCPTKCLQMGGTFDLSCYSRDGTIVDFCKLPPEIATGRDTINPTIVAQSKLQTEPYLATPSAKE